MPRSNSSVPRHRRHRKIVKLAKGYFGARSRNFKAAKDAVTKAGLYAYSCLLYTSPSPRDAHESRMPSSA